MYLYLDKKQIKNRKKGMSLKKFIRFCHQKVLYHYNIQTPILSYICYNLTEIAPDKYAHNAGNIGHRAGWIGPLWGV